MELTQEHLRQLKTLMESVKRAKSGKPLTIEQQKLWNRLTEDRRGKERTNFTEFDSMAAMAAQTGVPIDVLRHAKKEGCTFVRHSRCDLKIFLGWFFNRSGNNENWTSRSKRAEALIRECNLRTLEKESIPFAEATHFLSQLVGNCFFGELSRLAAEFPAALKGKTEIQISEETSRQVELIKSSLNSMLAEWQKKGIK